MKVLHEFLSTPSARRATSPPINWRVRIQISIHALREEGDMPAQEDAASYHGFLSTPSARRATLRGLSFRLPAVEFLSTPSARRATPAPNSQCSV